MSTVIYYLYAADLVNGINNFCFFIAFMSAIVFLTTLIVVLIDRVGSKDLDDDAKKTMVRIVKVSLAIFLISSFGVIATPESRTIYAAAGLKVVKEAEAAQTLTEDVKSILEDVKTIIHKQAEK